MSAQPGEPRRITLASGVEFRVLAFTPFAGVPELHVCPACSEPRVVPEHWETAGPKHWAVVRRCPDCGWQGAGRHAQPELERYDDALDQATADLVHALRTLVVERMTDDVERFLDALAADHVLPEDF